MWTTREDTFSERPVSTPTRRKPRLARDPGRCSISVSGIWFSTVSKMKDLLKSLPAINLRCQRSESTMVSPALLQTTPRNNSYSGDTQIVSTIINKFCFRLQTCDRAEYLFQTSDQKELETWVDTINTVISRYSSPPLPAPCSNSVKVLLIVVIT